MQLVPVQVITASEATVNIEETLFYFNGYEDRDMDITLAQSNEVAVAGEKAISDTLETFRTRTNHFAYFCVVFSNLSLPFFYVPLPVQHHPP